MAALKFSRRPMRAGLLLFFLRAGFWIALLLILIPRLPQAGFGRPGGGVPPLDAVLSWTASALPQPDRCNAIAALCAGEGWLLHLARTAQLRSLEEVKAEIDQSIRARGARQSGGPLRPG
jgi:hypothetical protein